jgi:mannonate dehydratase
MDPIGGLEIMKRRAEEFGLRMSVVEGYLPIERIVLGQDGRDAQIGELTAIIRQMGKLGVEVLCYNFMPFFDWTRTSFELPARGGAMTNGFDAAQIGDKVAPEEARLSSEQMWANLEYFLRRIVPVAEDAGVKLAMHPDDPPMPRFMGTNQIFSSVEGFERLVATVPSPVNGICFCQGNFTAMGTDVPAAIERLGKWIHYVHFRDLRGGAKKFVETFHDNGQTDMNAAMRAYQKIGFRGPARPDHVPKLEGEEGKATGYTMLGRLFAVGYMRGLIDAAYGKSAKHD